MNKKIMLSLGTTSLVALPIVSIVSCSNNSKIGENRKFFNVSVDYKSIKNNTNLPSKVNIYQAPVNQNAINELNSIQQNLTVGQLNFDFKRVLTDFYEAYEFKSSRYEVEIERINVKQKNSDGSFTLRVYYEIDRDYRTTKNNASTKDNVQYSDINWKPNMKLITKDDIEKIKNDILNLSNIQNPSFDIKDIKELFLGERDADDFDDIGIFDRIAIINKSYNGLASLLAYEISIDDIFSKLPIKPKTQITTKTKFLVPSISLNSNATVFIPNQLPDMDYVQKSLSKSQLDAIFGQESVAKVITSLDNTQSAFVPELNKLFVKQYLVNDLVGSKEISKIYLLNPNVNGTINQYQVIIEFKNSRKTPDLISFIPNDSQF